MGKLENGEYPVLPAYSGGATVEEPWLRPQQGGRTKQEIFILRNQGQYRNIRLTRA